MATRTRTGCLVAVAVLIGVLGPLVLAEIVLQFMPVLSGLYQTPVDAAHPIARYEPDHEFTYSLGPRFETVVHGRTNNLGWVNAQDYDTLARSPLLAVVGDSYVEALMVPYAQTLQGRLAARLAPRARVYSFGISGAPLSHYLMEADYARRTVHPTALAVVVVGNDFDESLRRYKVAPGQWGFASDSAGRLHEQLEPYQPSRWRRLLRRSALVRYLLLNVKLDAMIASWRARPEDASAFAGNVRARADQTRLEESRRAVDAFLSRLPAMSGVAPACIALVVDGVRPQIYDPRAVAAADSSYFGLMRAYLMAGAHREGLTVVDLQPAFIAEHARTGARFDFPDDGHWNAAGHAIAASAFAQTSVYSSLADPRAAAACTVATR